MTEIRLLDPAYSGEVDLSNPARVIRALEVCIASGKPYSALRKGHKAVRDFRIIKFAVDMPREELYMRINQRVDMMIAAGLEDEAKALSPYRDMNALQTVGYKELFDYFDGNSTFDEAVELIKRNSRRYAKRQLTWFRRDPEIIWLKDEEIRFAEKIIQKFVE